METLRWHDVQTLFEFLIGLYDLRTRRELTDHLLHRLPSLVPTEFLSYNEIATKRGRPRHYAAWSPKDATSAQLLTAFVHHLADHPVVNHWHTRGDGRAYRWSDFLTQRQFQRTGLYNEYYRRLGVDHQLCVAPCLSSTELIGLAFNRKGCDCTERDRRLLNVLNPHLTQAFRNADSVTRWQEEQRCLSDLVDRFEGGALEVSAAGTMIWATPQARATLEQVWGPDWRRRDRLPGPLREWVRHQTTAFTDVEHTPHLLEPLVVPTPAGRLCVRLVRREGDCVLFLERQDDHLDTTQFRQQGLTAREAEIVRWIVQGKSNADIGVVLGISEKTVKKHMERIFQKLGVETRTAVAVWALEQRRAGLVRDSPLLERLVPASPASHRGEERVRLFGKGKVAAVFEEHRLGAGEASMQPVGLRRRRHGVVLAG